MPSLFVFLVLRGACQRPDMSSLNRKKSFLSLQIRYSEQDLFSIISTPSKSSFFIRIPTQWRNVTIWCPPAHFFCRPHKFFTVSKKKKKKKKKKVATFFSLFLIGFLPPYSFLYPQIFFHVDRTLSWPSYGSFCCFVKRFFV